MSGEGFNREWFADGHHGMKTWVKANEILAERDLLYAEHRAMQAYLDAKIQHTIAHLNEDIIAVGKTAGVVAMREVELIEAHQTVLEAAKP